jgi:Cys-rich repeat protein
MKHSYIGLVAALALAAACSNGTNTGSPDASVPTSSADQDNSSTKTPSKPGPSSKDTDSDEPVADAAVDLDASPDPIQSDASTPAQPVPNDGGVLPPLPPPCRGLCDEGELCNVATDKCVQCLADSHCGDGEECRSNKCEKVIACEGFEECPKGLPVCHSQLDRCVECEIDLDCAEGKTCSGRTCVTETEGSSCAMGADPCSSGVILPMKVSQSLDGRGDEFCDIPGFELNFRNAARGNSNLPHSMVVRTAWSTEAFHLYAEVTDPEVVTNPEIEYLWSGDTVELFLAPQGPDKLTGRFTGRTDGVQLLIAPPTSANPTRAARLYWMPSQDNPEHFVQVREPLSSGYVARATATGYAVEARLPWSMFGPRTPAIKNGSAIAFDVGFSTANNQTITNDGDGREGAVVLHAGETSGVNTCDGDQVPWCNSTTWCPVELAQRLPKPTPTPNDAGR